MSQTQTSEEATKLMGRCDTDGNGSIGREEFGKYYEKISGEMYRFRKEQEAKAQACHRARAKALAGVQAARAAEQPHRVARRRLEAHEGEDVEVEVYKFELFQEGHD